MDWKQDDVDEEFLSGVKIRLQNILLGYDREVFTNEEGVALFYEEGNPLELGLYDMHISLDGYVPKTQQIQIENGFRQEEIRLISQ